MNVNEDGSIETDCNCLLMHYCDGASFSGFRPKPWAVPSVPGESLYFRGIKNLDGTFDWAFRHGLDKATEFVLTGHSAGGLSTFLHVDRVADRLAKEAPDCKHVRAAPTGGYFLDHANFKYDEHAFMGYVKYMYHMHNLTFGADGGLTAECQSAFASNPHYCFWSPYMHKFIRTPFFMFNSKYDAYQLARVLDVKGMETAEEQSAVLQYGSDFLKDFEQLQDEPKNGGMITSCICHNCPWSHLALDGKSSYQHYADWSFGKASGADALHVDSRTPNGAGTITHPYCAEFKQAS